MKRHFARYAAPALALAGLLVGVSCTVEPASYCGEDGGCAPQPLCPEGMLVAEQLSLGRYSSCALLPGGEVSCWGRLSFLPEDPGGPIPRRIFDGSSFKQLSLSWDGLCALDEEGMPHCLGNTDPSLTPFDRFEQISAGGGEGAEFTCGLRTDGAVLCAGPFLTNSAGTPFRGQRGTGPFQAVTVGPNSFCGIDVARELWCGGIGFEGQLGTGDREDRPDLARVAASGPWAAVSTGMSHTCALREDGTLWCFGSGRTGALGSGAQEDALVPQQLSGGPWGSVAAGANETCAVGRDGSLWCWGAPNGGAVSLPARVTEEGGFLDVATGAGHSCALRADHSVWCWGSNQGGATGDDMSGPRGLSPLCASTSGAGAGGSGGGGAGAGSEPSPCPDGVVDGDYLLVAGSSYARLAGCTAVTGDLELHGSLQRVELPALVTIGGALHATDNRALTTIDLPALRSIGASFELASNPVLTSLSLPALESVGGSLSVHYDAALGAVDLPQLVSVHDDLELYLDDGLTRIDLPSLVWIGGGLRIYVDPLLQTLRLPALTSLGQELSIRDNPRLASCVAEAIRDQLLSGDWFGAENIAGNDDAGTCP